MQGPLFLLDPSPRTREMILNDQAWAELESRGTVVSHFGARMPDDMVDEYLPDATFTEQLGSDSFLYCELSANVDLTIHKPGQTSARRSDTIDIHFPPEHYHVFKKDQGEPARPRWQLEN